MEQASEVGRRLAQLDDVIVHAARLARSGRRAPVMLRSCVERLLIESEIARLTLLLDPRSEKLLSCVDEMNTTGSLPELGPHVIRFEGVPQ